MPDDHRPIRDNHQRAKEAEQLLVLMEALTGVSLADDGPHTVLTDVLAHLMHYCRESEVDFEDCLRAARIHFRAEVCQVCGDTAFDHGICSTCEAERLAKGD